MKKIIPFVIVLMVSSCAPNQNVNNFKKKKNTRDSYLITLPNDWETYKIPFHGKIHSPILNLKNISKNIKTFLDISTVYLKNQKFEFVINRDIKFLQEGLVDFQYQIIKTKHKTYGNSYVLRYSTKESESLNKKHIVFYLKKDDIVYCIYFESLEENFNYYIKDVENIIQSFKVNKDYRPR
jgi:hypothetical protein